MSEFKREERYVAVKLKKLTHMQERHLFACIKGMDIPTIDCLVIEADWPEYESAWQSIERRMTGQPAVTTVEELEAVRHWRGKHTQAIREREALQVLLTAADEKNDTLSVAYLRAGEREHELRLRAHRLEGLLSQWANLLGVSAPGMRDETLAVFKPT